ncbi:MAG: hypothetical protein Q8936_24100 [Bacillota bacterium]|nr:hypothetical protein [Bacillota bacterium]
MDNPTAKPSKKIEVLHQNTSIKYEVTKIDADTNYLIGFFHIEQTIMDTCENKTYLVERQLPFSVLVRQLK